MGGISPVSTPHARSSPTSLALVEHLSGDRLSTYLAACDDNLDAAVVLYAWNGEVTGAFWEHLGHVEVSLRNTLDARLAARHDRLRRAGTWLDDPARELTERARKDIATARSRVKAGKRGSHGQVLSELSFGFWRFLVSKTCSGRFWPDLASGFPHAPNRSLTTIETPVRELWVGQRSCPHLCGGCTPGGHRAVQPTRRKTPARRPSERESWASRTQEQVRGAQRWRARVASISVTSSVMASTAWS